MLDFGEGLRKAPVLCGQLLLLPLQLHPPLLELRSRLLHLPGDRGIDFSIIQ